MSSSDYAASGSARFVATQLPSGARLALRLLGELEGGAISLELPGGERRTLGSGHCVANWRVYELAVFDRVLTHGDIGLGESFMDGQWDSDDPAALLTLLAANRRVLTRAIYGNAWQMLGHRLYHLSRRNTRTGARRNIEAHYDLGNDFYRLWLDETMTYSSALFASADEPLAEAQRRKYRRILDQLDARPGQTVLEIGCGWGGFAEIAAREYGCKVLGVTLSASQLAFARQRSRDGGYADRVDFELCDYRDVRGSYDHIVSIEMLEAVGERFWKGYFGQLAERLKPGGRAVVQVISIDEKLFPRYRRGTDFIQRYIFPGGMLPSPERIRGLAEGAALALKDDFAFGLDYARTLVRWHERFVECRENVRAAGFDERFVRMWRFYLAYCEAGFRVGDVDVRHFTFAHRGRD
ncbi:MAG: class I SAM-dependent methyltransferase [Zoogloeaceae bacterium]|nr:class I SAM-dependent methyltransferase [Zoogloeaceae bacterium]